MRHILIFLSLLTSVTALRAQTEDDCSSTRGVVVTIQSTRFPSLPGQAVTFNTFVEAIMGTAIPEGTIQFIDGSTDLGSFPLKQGQTSLTRTFTDAGAHVITALYSGDVNYCGRTATFGQQVERLTSSITVASSAPTAAFGAPVTFAIQLDATPAGVAPPTGPVQILDNNTVIGSAAPVNGKASITVSNFAPGTHQIVAVLTGDLTWFNVRSAPLVQTVSQASTATILTVSASTAQTTLTARVATVPGAAAVAEGMVQFIDTATNAVLGAVTLPATSLNLPGASGRSITAVYSGTPNYAASTSAAASIPALISATGATQPVFTVEEIVSLFGTGLANSTAQSTAVPLPTTLGGKSVDVTDSAGTSRPAGLYLVSPTQVNFVIPPLTAPGDAVITLTGAVPVHVTIGAVAPGLFSAAQLVRARGNAAPTIEAVTADTPIHVGTDTVFLVLFGTGIRNRVKTADATVEVGNSNVLATYAGPQSQFPGLDQVNIQLLPAFDGSGKKNVTLVVDGQRSNTVTFTFQ
jgi:uncharacterized protein (TIGR03437 family)